MLLVTILISDHPRPPAKAISDLSASSLDLATPGCGRTQNTAGQETEESQVILLMSRAICNLQYGSETTKMLLSQYHAHLSKHSR